MGRSQGKAVTHSQRRWESNLEGSRFPARLNLVAWSVMQPQMTKVKSLAKNCEGWQQSNRERQGLYRTFSIPWNHQKIGRAIPTGESCKQRLTVREYPVFRECEKFLFITYLNIHDFPTTCRYCTRHWRYSMKKTNVVPVTWDIFCNRANYSPNDARCT